MDESEHEECAALYEEALEDLTAGLGLRFTEDYVSELERLGTSALLARLVSPSRAAEER